MRRLYNISKTDYSYLEVFFVFLKYFRYFKYLHYALHNVYLSLSQLPEYDFEQSELILYQNMILRESGQLELALSKLEENAPQIVDRVAYMEARGEFIRISAL